MKALLLAHPSRLSPLVSRNFSATPIWGKSSRMVASQYQAPSVTPCVARTIRYPLLPLALRLSSARRSCGARSHGESITPRGSGTTGVKRHSGMLKGCLSTPSTSPSFRLEELLVLDPDLDLDPLGLGPSSLAKLSMYHFLFCSDRSSHSGMAGLRVSTPRISVRAVHFFCLYFSVNCPRAYLTVSPDSSTLTLHLERAGLWRRVPSTS
mmetsp:Transcript_19985/g.49972  ORF Transcript_19985/g.49972 Transcript_19985/m.49972 type:complete len:209 (-) Transcript_19985:163-789(-)